MGKVDGLALTWSTYAIVSFFDVANRCEHRSNTGEPQSCSGAGPELLEGLVDKRLGATAFC